jgi:hypothetical protein
LDLLAPFAASVWVIKQQGEAQFRTIAAHQGGAIGAAPAPFSRLRSTQKVACIDNLLGGVEQFEIAVHRQLAQQAICVILIGLSRPEQ